MGHRPHLFLGETWADNQIPVSSDQVRHLEKVLRKRGPTSVTYTDGSGTMGEGIYAGGQVTRGEERSVDRLSQVVVAVAPPKGKDRQRFLVEKLQELGAKRLIWLNATFGEGTPPRAERSRAWAAEALQQSRGSWLIGVEDSLSDWSTLPGPLVVCDPSGSKRPIEAKTVVIGPEGGWAPGEIPDGAETWSLGPNVLRVETAAVVAVSRWAHQW